MNKHNNNIFPVKNLLKTWNLNLFAYINFTFEIDILKGRWKMKNEIFKFFFHFKSINTESILYIFFFLQNICQIDNWIDLNKRRITHTQCAIRHCQIWQWQSLLMLWLPKNDVNFFLFDERILKFFLFIDEWIRPIRICFFYSVEMKEYSWWCPEVETHYQQNRHFFSSLDFQSIFRFFF